MSVERCEECGHRATSHGRQYRSAERCAECRALCAIAGSGTRCREDGVELPALARREDGAALCDGCVARHTRCILTDGMPAGVYLSSDGRHVTSWGGAIVGRVTREAPHRGGRVTSWRAVMPNGRTIYGRGAGRGMFTLAHPYRGK